MFYLYTALRCGPCVTSMGVAKGGSWGSWDPPNPPVLFFYHGRGGVQYSTVSSVLYAVRLLCTSDMESSRIT